MDRGTCNFTIMESHARRRLFGVAFASIMVFISFVSQKMSNEYQIQTLESHGTRKSNNLNEKSLNNETIDDHSVINSNLDLIRPRPRDLRLVFIGDSLTRYQYLSLAYFLRYGRWFDPSVSSTALNLMNSHSFHHPFHPQEDWNEFFLQSNRMLLPLEACDCYRNSNNSDIQMERRYFRDENRNNILVYININGNETPASWGYYGRFDAHDIFASFHRYVGLPFGMNRKNASERSWVWQYPSWAQVIQEHIGSLGLNSSSTGLKPTSRPGIVLLNAGLHSHDFQNPAIGSAVSAALNNASLTGIWKTTTFDSHQLLNQNVSYPTIIRPADLYMCELLKKCLNISWTAKLRKELYFDRLHFSEPVHRIINEELLQEINALPRSYIKMNRSSVTCEISS